MPQTRKSRLKAGDWVKLHDQPVDWRVLLVHNYNFITIARPGMLLNGLVHVSTVKKNEFKSRVNEILQDQQD